VVSPDTLQSWLTTLQLLRADNNDDEFPGSSSGCGIEDTAHEVSSRGFDVAGTITAALTRQRRSSAAVSLFPDSADSEEVVWRRRRCGDPW
jgi:hypothetical protein